MPPLPFSTQCPPGLPMNSYLIIVVTPQKMWYNVRHPFAYVGMAWAMDLIKTSFPPMHNKFSFRPLTLWTILSIRCRKQSVMFAPTNAGKPKFTHNIQRCTYLQFDTSLCIPREKKYLICSHSTIGLSFDNICLIDSSGSEHSFYQHAYKDKRIISK